MQEYLDTEMLINKTGEVNLTLDLSDPSVWDTWRNKYDSLTSEEQKQFHDNIEALYPEQAHFAIEPLQEAFQIAKPLSVIEIGGWKGDMAKAVLKTNDTIISWKNIELCPAAIALTVCTDKRYSVEEPASFDWFLNPPFDPREIDIVVATHFLEHISNQHLEDLLTGIKGVKYIYLEVPLSDTGEQWNGFIGTHKLTHGWNGVEQVLSLYGYFKVFQDGICRLFKQNNG